MPRVGDVFQLLSGTLAVPNTTIASSPYNAQQNDWVTEANNPRPITAGGTGATTATAARTNLGAIGANDLAAAPTKANPVGTDSVVIIDSEMTEEDLEENPNKNKRWLISALKASMATITDVPVNLVSTSGTEFAGPHLYFDRQSPTPLAGDTLGAAHFLGKNSIGTANIAYADFFAQILDPTNTTEDGQLIFRRMVNGAATNGLVINSAGVTVPQDLITGGDLDVTGNLDITGTSTFGGAVTFNTPPVINAGTLQLSSTDSSATALPVIYLDRLSPTPAALDALGSFLFRGKNSAAATVNYAQIYARIEDPINASEDASIVFNAAQAGSLSPALVVGPTQSTVFSALSVQGVLATTSNLTVAGTSTFTGAATFNGAQTFNGASTFADSLGVTGTDSGATGPNMALRHNSASPANGDVAGTLYFQANNSAAVNTNYGYISVSCTDVVNSSEDATMTLVTVVAGALSSALTLAPTVATLSTPINVAGAITTTTGSITSAVNVTSNNGAFIGQASQTILGPPAATGPIFLRPNGFASTTNQTAIDATGNMTVSGNITSVGGTVTTAQNFTSSSAALYFAPASAGNITFRPGGILVTATQSYIDSGGNWITGQDFTIGTGTLMSSAGVISIRPAVGGAATGALRLTSTTLGVFGDTGATRGALALPTGTIQRTTYATSTVTLPQLAGVVMAIVTDLKSMGFFS